MSEEKDYISGFNRVWEIRAIRNEPVPHGLSLAECKAYLSLRTLYRDYREGKVSKTKAQDDKRAIINAFTREKGEEVFLSRQALSLKERISDASQRYADNPTIENADALYAAFWNLPQDWRERKDELRA